MELLNGLYICMSNTDERSGFTHGKIYIIEDGILKDNYNHVFRPSPFADLDELNKFASPLRFREVFGIEDNQIGEAFTGAIFCDSSKDPDTFTPGYVYLVFNGGISMRDYEVVLHQKNGKDFCKELQKIFPGTFIPVHSISAE